MGEEHEGRPADYEVLSNKLDNLHALTTREYQEVQKIYRALYGYDDKPGLMTRIALLEGRMQMLWYSIGVIGSATVVALVNLIINLFKR